MIAQTPAPPYYAVIFTSIRTDTNDGYTETAAKMIDLAKEQPGFLGMESLRDGLGITISYWADLYAIHNWKNHIDHSVARERGRKEWYKEYRVRICKVEREYGFHSTR